MIDASSFSDVLRAAEQGDAEAQCNIGVMYANGEGVPQDDAEAVKWFRRAAEQGNADAQNNLAVMYANGKGVPQDDAEAVKWFRRIAEQRKTQAEALLAYRRANSSPCAAKWFRRVAEQRKTQAEALLAYRRANSLSCHMEAFDGRKGGRALTETAGIYIVHAPAAGLCKIGKTGDFRTRFTQLQSLAASAGNGNIEPVVLFPINDNRANVEAKAHSILAGKRTSGEWFRCEPDEAIHAVVEALKSVGAA